MIYRFGSFELDEERYELRRGSAQIALPRKSFDLLHHLLRNAGRVLSKEELFAAVWPQEHVTDSVLPVNIRTIRRALGDEESAAILRTVRGRGYFIECPVEGVEVARAAAGSAALPIPIPLAAPSAAAPARVVPRLAPRGFVGRETLLEELQAELSGAAEGNARALFLYGEAGIGKTRVLEEFALYARQQGALVVQARCDRDSGAPPFWTIIQLFQSVQTELKSEQARGFGEQVSAQVEETRARVRDLSRRYREQRIDSDTVRFRMSRIAISLTEQITRLVPVVVVIDDLQGIDSGSLRVWEAVVRGLRERRLLTLAAYRDSDVRPEHRLARALGALATEPGLRQIGLRGFSAEEVAEFVGSQIGVPPEAAFVRELIERTDGNPFFVREILRLLSAEGKLRPDGAIDASEVGLPRASQELIERRMQTVSRECDQALTWAAVIGRQFSFPLLEQVCDFSSERLLELLRESACARLIGSESSAAADAKLPVGSYSFTHALLRETLYARLSGPERVIRHRAVAEVLERMVGADPGERLAELAHHFFEAAPGGDINRAVDYCVRAARRALSVFDYDNAVGYFKRAARAEELRVPRDELRACCVGLALGDTLRRAARHPEAQTVFVRASQKARSLRRADLLAYSALGLTKWPRFLGPQLPFQIGERRRDERTGRVLALVYEALYALRAAHPQLQARLLAVCARAEAARGRRGPAVALSERAADLAQQSKNRRALLDALMAKRVSLHVPQDAARALEVSSEIVERASEVRARPLMFAAYETRIPTLLTLGDIAAADRDIASASDIAARLRAPAYEYAAARLHLGRALGGGKLESARALLQQMLASGTEAGDPDVSTAHAILEVWLLTAEGRAELARPSIEALADRGQLRSPAAHAFAASYWASIGERPRCTEHFEQVAAHDFEDLPIDDDWPWNIAACADVCAELRDVRRAGRLYPMLASYAAINVTSSLGCYRGSAEHWLGSLALVLGDPEGAWAHFERALEFNRRIGATTALVLTQHRYGSALLRGSGDERGRGQALLESARKTAEQHQIGALRHADLADQI